MFPVVATKVYVVKNKSVLESFGEAYFLVWLLQPKLSDTLEFHLIVLSLNWAADRHYASVSPNWAAQLSETSL